MAVTLQKSFLMLMFTLKLFGNSDCPAWKSKDIYGMHEFLLIKAGVVATVALNCDNKLAIPNKLWIAVLPC